VSQKLSPTVAEALSRDTEQTINMEVVKSGFFPHEFTLRKGVPVKWVINGKELTYCNKVILVPQYQLRIELKDGIQIVEFTPPESGVVPWSCWMGMIHGTFIVVDNAPAPAQDVASATQTFWQKYPALEAYRQRFVQEVRQLWQRFSHEAKQLWRRLESFYLAVLAGK